MKNRNIIVSLEKSLSEPAILNCGVSQWSVLGHILFLLYVNDMRLYADDTCLLFSNGNVSSMEKRLNVGFNSLCERLIDSKLSIHLGEDKTKCILFKKGKKHYPALNSTGNKNEIKKYSVVEYLGCLLDENMSGESMAKRALKKINGKTKFLYRQNRYLSYPLKRMLCH